MIVMNYSGILDIQSYTTSLYCTSSDYNTLSYSVQQTLMASLPHSLNQYRIKCQNYLTFHVCKVLIDTKQVINICTLTHIFQMTPQSLLHCTYVYSLTITYVKLLLTLQFNSFSNSLTPSSSICYSLVLDHTE